MNNQIHPANSNGHGDYERSDIGVAGVLYFLAGLAVAGVLVYFVADGIFAYLNKRLETEQPTVNPLVTSAPADTRRIPPQYGNDYEKYLKEGFPAPQLEVNERTELNDERLREENTLSTYDWVDKSSGTIRIPIDRAMDLLAQRGLPVRDQLNSGVSFRSPAPVAGTREAPESTKQPEKKAQPEKKKGSKK
jgi:hypothetical protein